MTDWYLFLFCFVLIVYWSLVPSFFCVGFSVSAWLVSHAYGADFLIAATVHQQEDDL
jgi:hypothetical protein